MALHENKVSRSQPASQRGFSGDASSQLQPMRLLPTPQQQFSAGRFPDTIPATPKQEIAKQDSQIKKKKQKETNPETETKLSEKRQKTKQGKRSNKAKDKEKDTAREDQKTARQELGNKYRFFLHLSSFPYLFIYQITGSFLW